ncbi:MAG: (S)-2-hydroxyglutarate dehydrogenase, partial [Thermoleophilaceae bacterium]|nr:(S)-2-hydroxyglutarate dehydrogenase [Thermoleophilaceae bacterium]
PGVARALADELRAAGAEIRTGAAVAAVAPRARRLELRLRGAGPLRPRFAVFCAGLWADRLAVGAGADPDPRIVPFRGAWLRLRPERRELVRGLIYPVPDPALPFLGVHLSRHTSGDVLIGPTALLAPARDAYDLRRVRPRDLASTIAWPGSWRMFARWWRTGAVELHHAASREAFVRAARRYVPELTIGDVEPGSLSGIRAQALGRDGRLVDDFVFSRTERALHVRNAPSPAATSALAIARVVAGEVEPALSR